MEDGFVTCQTPFQNQNANVRLYYLIVRSDGEGAVLQLFGREMCQDIGNISRNIGSGGERKRLVAIATNGHFPAREIEVYEPLGLWLTGQNINKEKERRTEPKSDLRTRRCRRRRTEVPKLSAGPERSPSPPVSPRMLLLRFLRTLKERTT
jgi:hypothetical protein